MKGRDFRLNQRLSSSIFTEAVSGHTGVSNHRAFYRPRLPAGHLLTTKTLSGRSGRSRGHTLFSFSILISLFPVDAYITQNDLRRDIRGSERLSCQMYELCLFGCISRSSIASLAVRLSQVQFEKLMLTMLTGCFKV